MTSRPSARIAARLLAVVVMLGGFLPILVDAPAASAQNEPPPAGIPDTTVANVRASLGIVTMNKETSLGWVAAAGVVVTSDRLANEVGVAATFGRDGSERSAVCYVAIVRPKIHLAVLRCAGLKGPSLSIESQYPAPGDSGLQRATLKGAARAPRSASRAARRRERRQVHERHSAPFQLRNEAGRIGVQLDRRCGAGAPVFNDEGKVMSTLFIAAAEGGQPLGVRPIELINAVTEALSLPDTFASAAIVVVSKRAVIPAAVGLVIGLIWGGLARNGTILVKAIGMCLLGAVATGAYTLFVVFVVGPQTIIS